MPPFNHVLRLVTHKQEHVWQSVLTLQLVCDTPSFLLVLLSVNAKGLVQLSSYNELWLHLFLLIIGQCLMHQSRRGTTPLTAASTWQYFERESSASSNSDLWNEFASGNTARIADFSWAGYNQGRSDPPLVAENTAGWPVFPVNCGSSVCTYSRTSLKREKYNILKKNILLPLKPG